MRNKTLTSVLKRADDAAAMERCGVAKVHQDAMRSYIDTWVRGPLRDAIAYLEGEKSAKDIEFWSQS